nr:MAG TPA: hypothetical protein [Caudoviricetes sp.]
MRTEGGGVDSRLCIARIAYWIEQISDVAIQFLAKVLQTSLLSNKIGQFDL